MKMRIENPPCDLRASVLNLEVKAVESVLPIHEAQLLTYLRVAKKRVGLLRSGINRVVNDYDGPRVEDGWIQHGDTENTEAARRTHEDAN